MALLYETTAAKASGVNEFIDNMRGLGWVEGRNIVYDRVYADDDESRRPVVGHRSQFVDDGALMSYSSVLAEQIRRSAHLIDKILKGAKPADIPVEQPTLFELVVNKKTAKALGIKFPGETMIQATRVIE